MHWCASGVGSALTLILVVCANPATCQEAAPEGSTMLLPPVEVTAAPAPLFLRPPPFDVETSPNGQPVAKIGADRFDNQPAFSAGEILRQSPGVSVKQGN